MPINFTDFTKIPLQKSALPDILPSIIEGYKMARLPQQMREEQRKRELENILLGEEISGEKLKNQYAPERYREEQLERVLGNRKSQNELDFQVPLAREDLLKQQLYNQYYGEDMESQIREREAQAQKNMSAGYTPTVLERDLRNAGVDPQSEEGRNILAGKYDAPQKWENRDIPQGRRPIETFPKSEQPKVMEANRKFAHRGETSLKVLHNLSEARKILRQYPNIANAAFVGFQHPDSPEMWKRLSEKFSNKNEIAAYQKLAKLSADAALIMGDSFGKNFTDAKAKMIERSKYSAGNQLEANMYLFDYLERENIPYALGRRDADNAILNRYEFLESDYNKHRIPEEIDLNEMVTIRDPQNPERKPLRLSRREAYYKMAQED